MSDEENLPIQNNDKPKQKKNKTKQKKDQELQPKKEKSKHKQPKAMTQKEDENQRPNPKKEKRNKEKISSENQNSSSSSALSIIPRDLSESAVVDPELDSMFKASKFPPLKTTDLTVTLANEKNDSKNPQKAKPPLSVDQITVSNNVKKQSGKKGLKVMVPDPNGSVESAYEIRLAIERAKTLSDKLKRDSESIPEKATHCIDSNALQKAKLPKKNDKQNQTESTKSSGGHISQDFDVSSDDNQSDSTLVHETLLTKRTDNVSSPKSKPLKPKKIESNETSEQKNRRTVFIGNVPIDCVTKKLTRTSLVEHILNPLKDEKPLASRARIESIRFRGIPLATPVVDQKKTNEKAIQRSKAWQEAQSESRVAFDDETGGRAGRRGAKPLKSSETMAAPPAQFLTPSQKRKVAYVTGNIHPEAKSCIAFAVISSVPEVSRAESNDLSAEELAELIAIEADGTSFLNHVLRCDIAGGISSKSSDNQMSCSISLEEQRKTLFIGGLDFLEEEDSIRTAVENKLLKEKGGLPDGATSWVERVRVVRDKATSLNKGFAYVLLRTSNAVEEMLALPEDSFEIGKRKVRLQKYLSTGQASALKKIKDPKSDNRKKGERNQKSKRKRSNQDQENPTNSNQNGGKGKKIKLDLTKEIETKYKGPDQSKELSNLSKSERKEIKSNNQLRVERRMLKKQNKLKMNILKNTNSKSIQGIPTLKRVKNKLKHKKSAKLDSKSKANKAKPKSQAKANTKFKPKTKPKSQSNPNKPDVSKAKPSKLPTQKT